MSSPIKAIGTLVVLLGSVLTAHAFNPQAPAAPTQNPVTREPVGRPVPLCTGRPVTGVFG